MSNGTLRRSKGEESNVIFTGDFKTMQLSIDYFELVRNPYKRSENDKIPNYLIYAPNRDGEKVQIGVAWHREYERQGVKGEMISLSIDDPSYSAALHVTAFKGENEDVWPITWRRERAKPIN